MLRSERTGQLSWSNGRHKSFTPFLYGRHEHSYWLPPRPEWAPRGSSPRHQGGRPTRAAAGGGREGAGPAGASFHVVISGAVARARCARRLRGAAAAQTGCCRHHNRTTNYCNYNYIILFIIIIVVVIIIIKIIVIIIVILVLITLVYFHYFCFWRPTYLTTQNRF